MGQKNVIPLLDFSDSDTHNLATLIIMFILHGPAAVNCAATLTTSGQTRGEARPGEARRGERLFKVKNRTQIANLHKIHSMMS